MAGNEWLNGYLEAILDACAKRSIGSRQRTLSSALGKEELGNGKEPGYNPTKYFVEEVVNQFDDTDLHKTWIKVLKHSNLL